MLAIPRNRTIKEKFSYALHSLPFLEGSEVAGKLERGEEKREPEEQRRIQLFSMLDSHYKFPFGSYLSYRKENLLSKQLLIYDSYILLLILYAK
jgi:hypothetical protein